MFRSLLIVLVSLSTVLVPAMASFANAPDSPTLRKVPAAWIGYVIVFILLAIVLAVSLMPSKRGHQD